jgi:hypothetical protein
MNYEDKSRENPAYEKFRGSLHIGMGIMYLVFGSVLIYIKYFGAMSLSPAMAYTLGTLMIIYGLFRLYRGFAYMRQKNKRNLQ